jgi:aspartyl-tRNA(Asn)/glutamyl-tRNA(Gln) amidotransferase subunit C
MARLTLEQVRAVAQLAALELDEREAQILCDDLGAILDHFASLAEVDVSGVEPTVHPVPLPAGWRADRAVQSELAEALLRAAPESDQGGFAVPKVLDGDP